MLIHVNPSSGVPIYLQIETSTKHYVAAAVLPPRESLPPARRLAAQLWFSSNTVACAYQELEREAVLRTVPGVRIYVADSSPGLLKSEKILRLRPHARQIAVVGKQLRLDADDIVRLVEEELDSLEDTHEELCDLDRRAR